MRTLSTQPRLLLKRAIVAGGGTVTHQRDSRSSKVLAETEGDEKTGVTIVLRALEEPVRQIAENAGFEGSVIVDKVKKSAEGVGFDAYNEEFVDMVASGIIDPVKVTRSALENAASVASMILTTEALVADKKEENPAPAAPAMGGGMY